MLLPHCNFCGFVNLLPCHENLKARCEARKAAKATERKQQAEARCLEEEAKQHAEEERQAREKQECHTWKHPSALTLRRPWNRSKRQHNSRPGLVRRLTGQVAPPKGQSRMLLRPYWRKWLRCGRILQNQNPSWKRSSSELATNLGTQRKPTDPEWQESTKIQIVGRARRCWSER